MLRRLHRAIVGLALLLSVGFIIGITIIPRIHNQNLLQEPSNAPHWLSNPFNSAENTSLSTPPPPLLEHPPLPSPPTTQEERFLSYSPHGDYLEQHEALRMAVRLAYETNRTVKAPPLRLAYGNSTWIHIPWSKLFDFSPLEQTFGIRIFDRPVAATTTSSPTESRETPLPTIEYEQAEYYERVEITHNSHLRNNAQQQKTKSKNPWFFMQWFQKGTGSAVNGHGRKLLDVVVDSSLPAPPKRIFTLSDLKKLESPYVHCNALGAWMFRKALEVKDQQQILNVAMTSTMLVRPDQLFPMRAAAETIVHALGGAGGFSGLTVHLNRMVPQEESDKWLYADGGDQLEGENSTTTMETRAAAARALMNRRRMNAIRDAAMELFSNMPIDQAVSAAMPVQASALRDYLDEHQERLKKQGSSEEQPLLDRRRLLDMCKDYRRHVDERFPIVYMMLHDEDEDNSSNATPTADPLLRENQEDVARILKPILDYFPCVFYRKDFYLWEMINASWAIESQLELAPKEVLDGDTLMSTQMVDYERLLSPLLDLLIAGQGYSFFEIPPSPLTRAVGWQLTGVDK
ncbi:hypothetical protein BDB00DRAFT_53468 [Zychaea mexicana]|uniref:uncharacterized protein n=1 Tax=Zychaea mexicana TaxID=64656 RepID=UPI0022FEE7AD|nr:uncharacterized protein BDB00DRAFT_53468 [Zychaea mexicana]KAI9497091.1 hypothetical protein BDB00DRAFT_53468 [Zychaea mexicana]